MIGIYKITSPNKRVYIGQSIDIRKRFVSYRNKECKQQSRLFASFQKYGVEKHVFEIVTECDIDDLNKWERYYQDLYHCTGRAGLNCRLTQAGDRSGKFSEEALKNMSIAQKISQAKCKRKGFRLSDETKEKIRQRALGRPSPFKGTKIPEEKRAWMKNRKNYTCPIWRRNLSLSRIGKRKGEENHKSKVVLNLETGIYYTCGTEAAKAHGINSRTLKNKLNGNKRNNTPYIYAFDRQEYKFELTDSQILRKRIDEASVFYLNLETGIYYFTIGEAASAIDCNKSTLTAWLRNRGRNRTSILTV